ELCVADRVLQPCTRRQHGTPQRQGMLVEGERLEEQPLVHRFLLEMRKVEQRAARNAARAQRLAGQAPRREQRVVEIFRWDGQLEAGPGDRTNALELLERDADALVVQTLERSLDAGLPDGVPDIAQLDAGVAQEAEVGAVRLCIDAMLDRAQEARLAVGEAVDDATPAL